MRSGCIGKRCSRFRVHHFSLSGFQYTCIAAPPRLHEFEVQMQKNRSASGNLLAPYLCVYMSARYLNLVLGKSVLWSQHLRFHSGRRCAHISVWNGQPNEQLALVWVYPKDQKSPSPHTDRTTGCQGNEIGTITTPIAELHHAWNQAFYAILGHTIINFDMLLCASMTRMNDRPDSASNRLDNQVGIGISSLVGNTNSEPTYRRDHLP